MIIGYASILHQGWSNQRLFARTGKMPQPYPRGSEADEEYQRGSRLAMAGQPWKEIKKAKARRGNVAKPERN